MPNLKEVRTRIASVESTKQITSAMKLVSASKLRKAQDAILKMRPYAEKLQEILSNLTASMEQGEESVYAQQRDIKRVLFIAVSSNRGLCGPFNTNVVKAVNAYIAENYSVQAAQNNVDILGVGRKVSDYFSKASFNFIDRLDDVYNQLDFEHASQISERVMEAFVSQEYDKVYIVYNRFKNAATQELTVEQFLPVQLDESHQEESSSDYIFEPSREEIVENMIPKILKIQFYKTLLDSHASEHGARMTAMHKATDNASELLKNLKLSYNKARQAAITNEILEIVGGAEALNG